MTVSTSTSRAGPYAGAGTTGPFPVPFRFLDNTHLQVVQTHAGVETSLVLSAGFIAIGSGSGSGTVYTTANVPVGDTITILRNVPITQLTDYVPGDSFPAESHEAALDKLTMIDQQQQDQLNQTLRVPEAVASFPPLPSIAARAGRILSFDGSGNPATVAPVAGSAAALAIDLTDPANLAKGAGQIGYGSGLNYAAGTVGKRLNELAFIVSAGKLGVTGTGDETVKMQAAVDSFAGVSCVLDLGGLSISITTVNIPNGKAFTVRNGSITVTGAGFGFSKATAVVASPARDMAFDNVHFTRSVTGGACVFINLAWQDSTGGVIVNPNCSFTLTNGAYGVRLARSFFSRIGGRFMMDGGAAGTSTAIVADASEVVGGDAAPSCPFTALIDNASFTGGLTFDQLYIPASVWNSFEGFRFGPGVDVYASTFRATKFNYLGIIGSHMVSAQAVIDSGNNTNISGGYWDRGANGQIPLTFKTTLRDINQATISGGVQFNGQGFTGDLIVFSDAGTAVGKQITNVVVGDSMFIGGINDVAQQINGIKFDHAAMRNLNMTGGQTFESMYGCINFAKGINRSVIGQFDAREITWYAVNVATGYGVTQYNRFDFLYRVLAIDIAIANYTATGANENVGGQFIALGGMMRPPVVSVSNVNSYFGAGYFTITAAQVGRDAVQAYLVKNIAAPTAGRGGCSATLTLDASQYVAPL